MAIRLAMWLGSAWWHFRGVAGVREYGGTCSVCRCAGMAHWKLRPDGKRLCAVFRG